jgi:hypothetical protein
LVFALEAVGYGLVATALLDRRMHQRDSSVGINQWGYRDEARASREPGEIRVALVGGSSAFEGGLSYGSTLAGQIFIELRAAGAHTGQQYSVVNLSEPRAGADSYVATLRDYSYFRPEILCIFPGFDVLTGVPPHGRRQSWVFRATGYLPILPASVLGRAAWMSDGDGGIADVLKDGGGPVDVSCAAASMTYCTGIADAVRLGLERGYAVMVVSPPTVSVRHGLQQRSLANALVRQFGTEPRFRYLDLGSALNLSDPIESPDGLRRTEIGNHVVGQKIALAILRWPAAMSRSSR